MQSITTGTQTVARRREQKTWNENLTERLLQVLPARTRVRGKPLVDRKIIKLDSSYT